VDQKSAAVEPTHYIVATYREHAHYLARMQDTKAAMAELFGRETGCSKGRGLDALLRSPRALPSGATRSWGARAARGRCGLRLQVTLALPELAREGIDESDAGPRDAVALVVKPAKKTRAEQIVQVPRNGAKGEGAGQ